MHRLALACSLALLAPAAYAAEMTLEIAPPEPSWFLPPEITPGPCSFPGGFRIEACPRQAMPEGIADVGEHAMIADLGPLLAAHDYAAVLTRIAQNYGPELALLEAGDVDGFLRTRMPTNGLQPPRPRAVSAPDSSRTRGSGLSLSERPESARETVSNTFGQRYGVGLEPDVISASLLYVIGHSYFSLAQYVPAEAAFELALIAVPNHVRVHESLGMLYLETERYADAREHLARAAELGRNTPQVYVAFGYLEQKTHRYSAAAAAFERALALAPADRSAQRGLLHVLTETREYARAEALVEQLLRTQPDDADLWRYRARIALARNERNAALASLETALRLGDESTGNRRACAALHIESGNVARAVALLRGSPRGLAFPLVDRALAWLANAEEWDDFRALLGSVDRATLGHVERSRLATHAGRLALRDGNRRAARTALEEAVALDPGNVDALVALATIHRAERDYGRADLVLQQAGAHETAGADAALLRAAVAIDREDYDTALAILRNLVASAPARADVRRNIDVLEDIALLRTER